MAVIYHLVCGLNSMHGPSERQRHCRGAYPTVVSQLIATKRSTHGGLEGWSGRLFTWGAGACRLFHALN